MVASLELVPYRERVVGKMEACVYAIDVFVDGVVVFCLVGGLLEC
jgi:hypothetical protein